MEFPIDKFIIKKTITSSDIKTATSINLTIPVSGEVKVDDIVLKTDATGLAAGTNLQIITDNAKGLANVMVTAISGLGANKTINLAEASVTKIKTVLEEGKRLKLNCTVADCTGAGTIDIYIYCSKASKLAKIY